MWVNWLILFISVATAANLNNKMRSRAIYDYAAHEYFQDYSKFELNIFNSINTSVDPCDNFYEFACGNFDNVPSDSAQNETHKDFFSTFDIYSKVNDLIKASDSSDPFRPFNFLKNFVTACNNLNANNIHSIPGVKEDKLDYFNEVISELGGWPVVQSDEWNDYNFDWINFMHKTFNNSLGDSAFLKLDSRARGNFTNFYYLDPPSAEFSYRETGNIKNNDTVRGYYNFMINVAEFLGADRTRAAKELWDSIEFEFKINEISNGIYISSLTDGHKTYGMSVEEIIEKWPSINWIKFLNPTTLPRPYFTNESIIFIKNHEFVTGLEKLLRETPKRVQANYAVWKTIQFMIPYVYSTTLSKFLATYLEIKYSRTVVMKHQCLYYFPVLFPELTFAYYINRYPLNGEVKSRVNQIAMDVNRKLTDILTRMSWLDYESRDKLIREIESTHFVIGYSEILLDQEKMEEYFRGLEITSDNFLKNYINAMAFIKEKIRARSLKPNNQLDLTDMLRSVVPMASSGFSVAYANIIVLGLASIKNLLFSINHLNYINYGVLGYIMSHEMGHSVDYSKTFFDKYGFEHDRWSLYSEEKYKEKENCFIEQIENLTVKETEEKLDGKLYLAENIADHIGIQVAYSAYQDWVKVHGPEPAFLNLPYNSNQLFWLSYASLWCKSKSVSQNFDEIDNHAPVDKRVIVPLSNTPEFSKDFNCTLGSKMNPVKKCKIFE